MKICLISNLYEPYYKGGAEQVVKDTIRGLKSRGEDVILITIQPFEGFSSLKPRLTEENGIKIYRFYPLNIFSYINIDKHNISMRLFWHLLDIFNIHSYFVIKNILRREKSDIVHTHNLKGIGYLIPKAIGCQRVKHVHTIHDIQLASPSGLMVKNEENNWKQKGIATKIYSMICRYLFGEVSIVISPSKWLIDYYTNKDFFKNSKQIILRNPININREINSKEISSQDDHERIVKFLFIGQIEEHKGILFLIDVFNSLKDLSIKLDIIGDGSILEEARGLSKSHNIFFLGRLSHQDVLEYVKKVDFIIVPSLCYENSPVVVLEALEAGKPVIAVDIGGTAELIKEDNGYEFEAGNKEDLVYKIKLAIENIYNFSPLKIRETINDLGVEDYIENLINLYRYKV